MVKSTILKQLYWTGFITQNVRRHDLSGGKRAQRKKVR